MGVEMGLEMSEIEYSSPLEEARQIHLGGRTIRSVARPLEGTQGVRRGKEGAVATPPEVEPSADGVAVAQVPEAAVNGNGVAVPAPATGVQVGRRVATVAKRAFDLVLAAVLLIVAIPMLVAIAIAIKLDSPGSILFRQTRIGRGGEPFGMLKFRTMIDGAHSRRDELRHLNEAPDGLFKIPGDPRLTRVGGFLRVTSLDELPQLVHVLLGRMSLVGPRPLVPEEDALILGGYRRRLEMRPGMTGPWQASGASKIPLQEMVKLDAEYVDDWTVAGDIKLLLRTVPHVVGMRGI
jgi:lipopolysaccharide/colanic/teichoic acid biosynthesis glycosyltransferase